MFGLGTIVNTLAVIGGSVIGLAAKSGLGQRFRETLTQAIGLATIFIGASGALSKMLVIDAEAGGLNTAGTMLTILSLVIGALIGELAKIEQRLEGLGDRLSRRFAEQGIDRDDAVTAESGSGSGIAEVPGNEKDDMEESGGKKRRVRIWAKLKKRRKAAGAGGNFTKGFVTASLIICVGAMAVVGSLQDGMTGDGSVLFAKSVLDFVIVMILSANLGIGVMFSAIPLFVYQGLITVFAGLIRPYITDLMISDMSMVGSVLIFAVGLNVLCGATGEEKALKIKVGNLLPAIFVPVVWDLIRPLF